jgi:hypothetical protein
MLGVAVVATPLMLAPSAAGASVESTAVTIAAATPGVQEPYVCPTIGAWETFLIGGSTALGDDEVEPRNGAPQPYMTGPLLLGVSVGPEFIRGNDGAYGEGDRFLATLVTAPQHAKAFELRSDGSFTWDPVDGYLGGDSFTYGYRLDSGRCSNATGTVTIPPTNGAPRFQDDFYTVRNDRPFVSPSVCSASGCGVLFNDVNTTAVNTSLRPEAMPLHGTLTQRSDGSFTYVPDPGYVGPDRFYYRLPNINAPATSYHAIFERHGRVDLDVVAPPPASVPIAVDDPFDVVEDTPLTVTAAQLLGNDVNAAYVVFTNTTAPGQVQPTPNGSIQVDVCEFFEIVAGACIAVNSIQAITYTPSRDYNGPDYFGYAVSSGWPATGQNTSELGWVSLNVTPVDDPPVVVADGVTVAESSSAVVDVLANDYDPEGDLDPSSLEPDPCVELPVCVFRSLANGSWVIGDDATITYTPTPGFFGTAGFHYQVKDARGVASRSYVVATVTANPAVDDAYVLAEDTPLVIAAPGLLANDRVGSTVVGVDRQPAHGTVVAATDGSFTYTPSRDHNGADSFTYIGIGGDTATVDLTVTPVRDDPFVRLNTACNPAGLLPGQFCAGDQDTRVIDEGSSVRVRGYIIDPDYDVGTLSTTWGDGTTGLDDYPCAFGEDCGFDIAPTWPAACGILACDGELFFDLSHTYADNAPDDAPMSIGVTATDAGGGSMTAIASATVRNVAPTVTLAPACESELCFGFFSRVSVDAGGTATLRGRVTDPGADDGTLSVDWGDGSEPTEIDLTCAVGAVCPQAVQQAAATACSQLSPGPACGYFTLSHVYSAPSGPDGFEVAVTAVDDDGGVGTASATARVANAAPVVTDFTVQANEDIPVDIDLGANVIDYGTADADLSYTVTGDPVNGVLTGTGPVRTYTPEADFSGTDTFTVEVCDTGALCATSTVTIVVAAVDDPPIAGDDRVTTPEDTGLRIDILELLANDDDIDSVLDPDTFGIVTAPSRGTAVVDAGVVLYTPAQDLFGEDSFEYEICSEDLCATATVTVEVTPVNDAPVVEVAGPASADEGSDVVFTFTVTDPDPGDTSAVASGSPSCGSGLLVPGSVVVTAAGGEFTCRWADGPFGASVSIIVEDAAGAMSDAATAGVSILNVTPAVTDAASDPVVGVTGAPVVVNAAFTDPGDDTHSAVVDWGDGEVSSLSAVARSGFEAAHTYASAGLFTVSVTVSDSDGALAATTFEIEVIDPAQALESAAAELRALVDGSSRSDASALQASLDALIGRNGGKAGNGADASLASGDIALTMRRILDAQKALDRVTGVDVSDPAAMLAGVARGLTEGVVAEAQNATGCTSSASTTCPRGVAKTFRSIENAVALGHARYAAGDWVGAVERYAEAAKLAQSLV